MTWLRESCLGWRNASSEDLCVFAPGILDSLRPPTPPARRDDTWPVTVASLANGRVQWVNLLSASAVAALPGGFGSILALRTPNSLIESPSCSCQHSFLLPPPSSTTLSPTSRVLLLSRPPPDSRYHREPTKQTYQVAFPAHLPAYDQHARSQFRGTNTPTFPRDAFASARRRHVRRGPGLPLQPALGCLQAAPARARQEQGLRP